MEQPRVTIVNTDHGQMVRFYTRHGVAERPMGPADRALLASGRPVHDLDPVGAILISLTGEA